MRTLGSIAALSLIASVACAKELKVQQLVGLMGALKVEETQYFTPSKVISENPGVRVIVDLDAKTVTTVNKREQFYTVKTFDDLQRETEAARAKGTAAANSAVTLEPTGKSQRVAGHKAKEYTIKASALSGTVWVAEDIPLSAEASKWGRVAWVSGDIGPDVGFQDALGRLKALPLLAQVAKPLGSENKWITLVEVKDVGNAAPPAEALTVPKDYTKRSLERPTVPDSPR